MSDCSQKKFLKRQKREEKKLESRRRESELLSQRSAELRQRAAWHEAAHVVGCLVFGIPVGFAEVGRRGDGSCSIGSPEWCYDPANPLSEHARGSAMPS